jgi:hypothetical protein
MLRVCALRVLCEMHGRLQGYGPSSSSLDVVPPTTAHHRERDQWTWFPNPSVLAWKLGKLWGTRRSIIRVAGPLAAERTPVHKLDHTTMWAMPRCG